MVEFTPRQLKVVFEHFIMQTTNEVGHQNIDVPSEELGRSIPTNFSDFISAVLDYSYVLEIS